MKKTITISDDNGQYRELLTKLKKELKQPTLTKTAKQIIKQYVKYSGLDENINIK